MRMTLRRTSAAEPAHDAELPRTLDVGALHTLLHQRGEGELAALLLMRLGPEGARDLAALLRRFRRRYSRPGLFRSYRRLLDAQGARQVDLAVAFLLGAGYAGCRVYPDPHTADAAAPMDAGVQGNADEREMVEEDDVDQESLSQSDNVPDQHHAAPLPPLPEGIMPAWLPRPPGSVWTR